MIFMGDEFGNSQKGNNNPYCQDNPVTWLDWNCLKKNSELAEFWKMLTGLRREHPILTPGEQLRLMDYIACGYPDLSYHGKSAWRLQAEYHSRQAGVMFCGRYARKSRDVEDDFLYLAMNMHWEKHELALPRLPKGMKWKLLLTTDGRPQITAPESEEAQGAGNMCLLEARSIAVFISEAEQETAAKKRTKTVPDDRTCF
jgi:glycogen operon protein